MIKDEDRNSNTQGIGLGLVISKLVVNKFKGQIYFISEYGSGSTFFFSFEMHPISNSEVNEFFDKIHSQKDSYIEDDFDFDKIELIKDD